MKPARLISPPGTYFVTFSTFQRRRFFIVETYARLFLKTLYGYRRQRRFQLHAFVLMPDHVHLLLTPAIDITLERAMQLIKGGGRLIGTTISRALPGRAAAQKWKVDGFARCPRGSRSLPPLLSWGSTAPSSKSMRWRGTSSSTGR